MDLKATGSFIEGLVNMQSKGHKELAIFFTPCFEEPWTVAVGNEYSSIMLGEVSGIYEGSGHSLEEAVCNVMTLMELEQGKLK